MLSKSTGGRGLLGVLVLAFAALICPNVQAIICHTDHEPPAGWSGGVDPNVVGKWTYNGSTFNASFVVISPNWIITTRHQSTNATQVTINGTTYDCNTSRIGGPTGKVDMRLIRLKKTDGNDPELTTYCPIYEGSNEADKEIVIGGWGRGRGANLTTNGVIYGYQWAETSSAALRWCTNIIDSTLDHTAPNGDPNNNLIVADFDGPTIGTEFEGIPAEYDSGGGWFIFDNGKWKLAGLTRGVEHLGEAWFSKKTDPQISDPDTMVAIWISSYAAWINSIIKQNLDGDLNSDNKVDLADYALLAQWWLDDCGVTGNLRNGWCGGADINTSGQVNYDDLVYIIDEWLSDIWL